MLNLLLKPKQFQRFDYLYLTQNTTNKIFIAPINKKSATPEHPIKLHK
jgi:hypothetical protein